MTPAKIKQGQLRIEEPFILTGMASLLGGILWMWVRHRQCLQYFYSPEFDLYNHRLRALSNVLVTVGVLATVVGIVSVCGELLAVSLGLVLGGVICFAINFAMMARWALLDLEYHPLQQAK